MVVVNDSISAMSRSGSNFALHILSTMQPMRAAFSSFMHSSLSERFQGPWYIVALRSHTFTKIDFFENPIAELVVLLEVAPR